jgi:hypothetical protein
MLSLRLYLLDDTAGLRAGGAGEVSVLDGGDRRAFQAVALVLQSLFAFPGVSCRIPVERNKASIRARDESGLTSMADHRAPGSNR